MKPLKLKFSILISLQPYGVNLLTFQTYTKAQCVIETKKQWRGKVILKNEKIIEKKMTASCTKYSGYKHYLEIHIIPFIF